MNWFVEMFSYGFMQRALVAGVLISLTAALIGVPLVLRKNSMIGDGLSHPAFGAFAVATVLNFAQFICQRGCGDCGAFGGESRDWDNGDFADSGGKY